MSEKPSHRPRPAREVAPPRPARQVAPAAAQNDQEHGGDEGASPEEAGPKSAREVLGRSAPSPSQAEPAATPEPPATVRRFRVDDVDWIARVAGESVYGTGPRGRAPLESVMFARAEAPDEPVSEALVPRGRFATYYDEELRRLLGRARPVDDLNDAGLA